MRTNLLFVLLAAVLTGGCTVELAQCETDADCFTGMCVEESCVPRPEPDMGPTPECTSDSQCPADYECMDNVCVLESPDAGTPDKTPPCVDNDGDGACASDLDCDDFDQMTYPGAPEICDGVNNDCDAQIDEEVPEFGMPCGTDEGVCETGVFDCIGGELVCVFSVEPSVETCNGSDDDCDGMVDEGVLNACGGCAELSGVPGDPCDGDDDDLCMEGIVSCASPDLVFCTDDSADNVEVCDLDDNDCDGAVDEGVMNACGGCGTLSGVPGATCDGPDSDSCMEGVYTCSGTTLLCTDATGSTVEVCNDLDDDCDGMVDEGVLNACDTCGSVPAETCDGLDNDCDGAVDEGVMNACGGCGTLANMPGTSCDGPDGDLCPDDTYTCSGANATVCSTGSTNVEHCFDGLDNDCDGAVNSADTDCQCSAFECGGPGMGIPGGVPVGGGRCFCDSACVFAGDCCANACTTCPGTYGVGNPCDGADGDACLDDTRVCVGSGGATACTTGDNDVEVCDGADNDCDGQTDDGNPGGGASCGTDVGACAIGMTACTGGALDCVGDVEPTTEVCGDGVDQDCDGSDSTCPPPPPTCSCTDADSDGFFPASCTDPDCMPGGDCNDSLAAVNPEGTEVCGDGVDQDCNGSDLACLPTETVSTCIGDPSSESVSLQTDISELGPFGWRDLPDTEAPFCWDLEIAASDATSELYRMNWFRTPAGDWNCFMPFGGTPTCMSMPTLMLEGTAVTVNTYDSTRLTIPAGQAAVMRDERYIGDVAVVGYCHGTAGSCEIACRNGLDDDGDGMADEDEPDCFGPAGCTNGADDDGDGLIDAADSDCP